MVRTYIHSFAKYGSVVAVLFEWVALLFFYIREPLYFNGEHPLSDFAVLPQTRIVFSLCYLGAAISFWIFARYHLKKYYRTPIKIFAFSMLSFAGVALSPYDPGNALSATTHGILVQSLFWSFILGMMVMVWHSDSLHFRIMTLCTLLLALLVVVAFLAIPQFPLIIEAGSWFVFQVWMIWVSCLAYRQSVKGQINS